MNLPGSQSPEAVVDAAIETARKCYQVGDYDSAAKLLQSARSVAPRDLRILNDLGAIHYQQQRYGEAFACLIEACLIENAPATLAQENLLQVLNTIVERGLQCVIGAPGRVIDLDRWLASSGDGLHRLAKSLPDEQWLAALERSELQRELGSEILPGFIDPQVQTNFVGSAGATAIREGWKFFQVIRAYCAHLNQPLQSDQRVLDFGAGWGRNTRIFLHDVHPDNLFGADVDGMMVEQCRKTFGYANFLKVDPFPPTLFRDGYFDLVFAYSVFSHLSPKAADAWVNEFGRIVRPGGLVFLTTQGRTFIDFCRQIREAGDLSHGWYQLLAKSFVDVEASLRDYDNGVFLHAATGGGGDRDESFYGESLIPRGYVEQHWTQDFELVDFRDDRGFLPQALIVLRRR